MKAQLIDLGCPADRIAVQHLGVRSDEIEFRPRTLKPGERVRIVCTARLVEKKGLEYAIRAVAKLRECELDAQLQIVGDGPLRSRLAALIDELEVRDRVTLHDPVSPPEAIRMVEHGHIFLLPSVTASHGDEEGTPVSILEVMATGIPVVSTLHSGIPEQIEDGVSGFLVPERDVESLTDRLAQLIRHPESWTAMGRAARTRVEINFDAGKQCVQLLDLYHSL